MKDNFIYTRRDLIVLAVALGIVVFFLGLGFGLGNAAPTADAELATEDIYQRTLRVLSQNPIFDGHNDLPWCIRSNFGNELPDLSSHLAQCDTDLPRMRQGMVGAQFWAAYYGCSSQYKDSVQVFLEQIDLIRRMVAAHPDYLVRARTADDVEDAIAAGKIAAVIGVESGHAIASSLSVLRTLYELGARYMTLTHNCDTPWATASTSEVNGTAPSGLSDFGRTVVREMNRVGMLVDLSHVSAQTMSDAIETSRAPVMFSHSSARKVYDVARNVPDDILQKVAINRGVVMVNFYDCYVADCETQNVTNQAVVDHLNHIRRVAGIDHVGIGGDYDGVESFPIGLEDVSKYPNLIEAIIEDDSVEWTDEDLAKLTNGNIIRVFREVEKVRDALSYEEPYQTWISEGDLDGRTECSSIY